MEGGRDTLISTSPDRFAIWLPLIFPLRGPQERGGFNSLGRGKQPGDNEPAQGRFFEYKNSAIHRIFSSTKILG